MGLYVKVDAADPGGLVVDLEKILAPIYEKMHRLESQVTKLDALLGEETRRATGIHNKLLRHKHTTGAMHE